MLKKPLFIAIAGAIALTLAGCGLFTTVTPGRRNVYVQRRPKPDPRALRMPGLAEFPSANERGEIDLSSKDLRGLDLWARGDILLRQASFDTATRWPSRMPEGYRPGDILQEGKAPGLGVRSLHRRGISGKGVSIGIVDQALLVGHVEYRDRIRHYEEIDAHEYSQADASAVASLAAGASVGVAPGADVFYVATRWDGTDGPANIARALRRLLEINSRLPPERKIRAISLSASWQLGDQAFAEADAAVNAAREAGIFIAGGVVEGHYDVSLRSLSRWSGTDPDDPESYRPAEWPSKLSSHSQSDARDNQLFVPMGGRTVASSLRNEGYVFYPVGGRGWSSAWIAGLYALAAQVRPTITPEEFTDAAMSTALERGPIVNPVGLIEWVGAAGAADS